MFHRRFHPRFTLRVLLVVVFIAATISGFTSLLLKRQACLSRATQHAQMHKECLKHIEIIDSISESDSSDSTEIQSIEMDLSPTSGQATASSITIYGQLRDRSAWLLEAEYHAALLKKYEHAASQPWRSIDPDPPKPRGKDDAK